MIQKALENPCLHIIVKHYFRYVKSLDIESLCYEF